MARKATHPRIVYVVGAGFSAGLGFPTIGNLLPRLWPRLRANDLDEDLEAVIRFHHPDFNASVDKTYPTIEELLSEIQANAELFDSSRPAAGNFRSEHLTELQEKLLLELARWFHDLQRKALSRPKEWLLELVQTMRSERADVVSFNWDLVLDEQLFGDNPRPSDYGFSGRSLRPRLIKPHGSLNWYQYKTGRHIKPEKRQRLMGRGESELFAFRFYREPISARRTYMPLIVPPVFAKDFSGDVFKHLWQRTVSVVSGASEVRFLGYSLPTADFHARFILRSAFYNQEYGELDSTGRRIKPTGRAVVTIVDPVADGPRRIEEMIGWRCDWRQSTVEEWVRSGAL